MGKVRKSNKHLPRRMYLNHGAYFYVSKDNKWINLGKEYPIALSKWADIEGGGENTGILKSALEKYQIEVLPTLAQSTQDVRLYQLKKLSLVFGHMLLTEIKTVHVRQYLSTHKSKSSANREVALLSAVFRKAKNWGWCENNPCNGVEKNKEKSRDKYVTDEEIKKLHQYSDKTTSSIIDFALATGMRRGDILDIKITDLTDNGVVVTQNKTNTKQLFLWSDNLTHVVDNAKKARKTRNLVYLFTNSHGQKISITGFNSTWRRLKERSGLVDVNFHDLRHRVITDAEHEKGIDYARKLAGHASVTMTEKYIASTSIMEIKLLK